MATRGENESFIGSRRGLNSNDQRIFNSNPFLRNMYIVVVISMLNLAILLIVVNLFKETVIEIFSDPIAFLPTSLLSPDPILDAVVPIHWTDNYVSFQCGGIMSIFQNFKPPIRKLYFVASEETKEKATALREYAELDEAYGSQIEWIDETIFPDDDWNFHYAKVKQQMLKMHIFKRIPTLGQNAVVVDADLRWLKPRTLVHPNGSASYGFELKPQERNRKFVETLAPGLNLSFDSKAKWIEHHMLFQKDVMEDLFEKVKEDAGTETFVQAVSKWRYGRVTEYEYYRAFAWKYWHDRVVPTRIPYIGSGFCDDETSNAMENTDIVFLACHDHRLFGNTWDVFNSVYCWKDHRGKNNRTVKPRLCNPGSSMGRLLL